MCLGLSNISRPTCSRIRKRMFINVDVKKSDVLFAKCNECELLRIHAIVCPGEPRVLRPQTKSRSTYLLAGVKSPIVS